MVKKTNHLEHVSIEEDFKIKIKRKIKMMPGEKSKDETSNFDSKDKYRIEVFRNIMDTILMAIDLRYTEKKIKTF
jgi:hypothetical protein